MILVWLSFSEGWRQVPQSHLERLPKGQALELPKGLRKHSKSYQNNNETIKTYFTCMLLSLAWKS